ncbi:MAG TPA: GNAT family N-acetyltransferase [Terriglobales bacterium]|nr:GNAT family N-acetyltransferase [Terriglobales bacterium]
MNVDLQPTLTGSLVELRPVRPDDFEQLFAAASDPLIWEVHPEPDRYQRAVFQKFFAGALECKGAFTVLDRKSGRVIGSTRFHHYYPDKRQVEIGWTFLAREFWGGDYNGEMKRLMLDHAFGFVDRVVFTVGENNIRSQKAVKKIGGVLIGTEDRPGLDGTLRHNVVFAIDKHAWKAAHV